MEKCYFRAMMSQMPTRGYLHPEQARFLMRLTKEDIEICLEDADDECLHWPQFTVVEGSPHPPYYPESECYKGFRSDPHPLMGVLRLCHDEHVRAWIRAHDSYPPTLTCYSR